MRAPAPAAAEGKIERLHERGADAANRLQVNPTPTEPIRVAPLEEDGAAFLVRNRRELGR